MPANTTDIEKRLWEAADDLRANSKLKSSSFTLWKWTLLVIDCAAVLAVAWVVRQAKR